MTNNLPSSFAWGDIELSQTIIIDNIPHTTRSAIGEWLEHSDPVRAVSKLLDRNPHIENYSTVVNLTTIDGKDRQVSVYHPIGFMLIVMESGQPKAHAMKVAVAEFVWHYAGPQKLNFKQQMELIKLQLSLFKALGKTKDAFVIQGLTERLSRVCLQLGQPMPDRAILGKDLNQLEMEV